MRNARNDLGAIESKISHGGEITMIKPITPQDAKTASMMAGQIQSVSPYQNPAHILSPPRDWLEAFQKGEISWSFFRFRYKSLLQKRFREDPQRIFFLLDSSNGSRSLFLSCHCQAGPCHREIAAEFLERMRSRDEYQKHIDWRAAGVAVLTSF